MSVQEPERRHWGRYIGMIAAHDLDHEGVRGSPKRSRHSLQMMRLSVLIGVKSGFVTVSKIIATRAALSMIAMAAVTSAQAAVLTLTLQQMDISVQPVGEPFSVTLSIQKDQDDNVTVDIPSITQTFDSSKDSPNFSSQDFPTLVPTPPKGDPVTAYSYPPLPPDYPLGGYIDTVDNAIPVGFRPTSGLPITFAVGSKVTPSLQYIGHIDNQGRLQFSALQGFPLGVGAFATLPARVTYAIGKIPDVTLNNFQISLGPSDAAKWNPIDFGPRPGSTTDTDPPATGGCCYPPATGGFVAIHFDFGDFNDPQKGFYNGVYYTTWADNSAALPYNSPDQAYKSYALAKIRVGDFGKTFKIERVVNLSRMPGGVTLDPNFTYAEGGVAIDPTNEMNLAVTVQQRKASRIGFVLSRSFDGGKTWTKKLLGLPDPNDPTMRKPLDPNLPVGGSDEHVGFDRFGGLWIVYLSGLDIATQNLVGPVPIVYSADKGETFNLIYKEEPLDPTQLPKSVQPFYSGLDYTYLGIGPDATNLNYDTVWSSVGDALMGDAPNEYQQRVFGLRVKGLGVSNIDLTSFKAYVLPGSHAAGWASIDVDPKGAVIVSLMQSNPKDTFLEQIQNNTRSWINVLENGLADDRFSKKREFALTATGDARAFPPQPHNNYLRPLTNMIAVDKSSQHPGRIYAVYSNRPGIYSDTNRPYLIWSDDQGFTWSNPINVSTDTSPATAILPAISLDPTTGVVAVSWQDARGSPIDTEVNEFGVFLDPRELN
ncbi:MAG: hypothetical protein WCB44_02465 [Stellaceae bacterium]